MFVGNLDGRFKTVLMIIGHFKEEELFKVVTV